LGEHVEIVRRAAEAASRKPRPDFDTMNELFSPQHEFLDAMAEAADGGRGFQQWFQRFNEIWETWDSHVEEVVALDGERVLVRYRFVGVGAAGHIPVDQEMANVMTVRGGQIVRTEVYMTPEEARRAAGGGAV
jgi:ketosteroid isomerase-like protein